MKAIIELYDVPEYQIGQEVTIYFRDTMQMRGICDEMQPKVVLCKDCKYGWNINPSEEEKFYVCQNPTMVNMRYSHQSNWFCADGERK